MHTHAIQPAEQFDDLPQQRSAARLGMWVFLATEVLFFGVLFAGYALSRMRDPDGFAAASRHTDVLLGGIEAAVLLASGALAAWAVDAAQREDGRRLATTLLGVSALLGVAFLVMHGIEYRHDVAEGLVPGAHFRPQGLHVAAMQLFYFLYYVMTGYHSLHVAIGVVALAAMAWWTYRGRIGPGRANALIVAALYWQLVDIVWIFLYPLIYLVDRA